VTADLKKSADDFASRLWSFSISVRICFTRPSISARKPPKKERTAEKLH